MNCERCQAPLVQDARFCGRCGHQVGAAAGKGPSRVGVVVLAVLLLFGLGRGVQVALNTFDDSTQPSAAADLAPGSGAAGVATLPVNAAAGPAAVVPSVDFGFSSHVKNALALLSSGETAQAVATLEAAASGGDGGAAYVLGRLYWSGFGAVRDDEKALRWIRQAFENKFTFAAAMHASMRWREGQPPSEHAEAFRWLQEAERAASDPLGSIALRLGEAYWYGLGTKEDKARAAEYFARAASAGLSRANLWLGFRDFDRGEHSTAVAAWTRAAAAGSADAQYRLYSASREGQGTPHDWKLAANWLLRSARQNYGPAMTSVGYHYSRGDLFPQNRAEFLKWSLRSAMAGQAAGMFNAGIVFASDPATLPLAYLFYNLAAARGHEPAREWRDRTAAMISAQHFTEMQALARDFDRSCQDPSEFELAATGTGFFVDVGTMVTNEHVIGECARIGVRVGAKEVSDVTIIGANADLDLALLWVRSKPGETYSMSLARLAPVPSALGESVTAFGYPLSGVLASSGVLTNGVLSSTAGLRDDATRFQFSAPVQPGNSGGPIWNAQGHVIGVVESRLNPLGRGSDVMIPQNVNFAVKTQELDRIMRANATLFTFGGATDPVLDGKNLASLAQRATGQVLCYQTKLEALAASGK